MHFVQGCDFSIQFNSIQTAEKPNSIQFKPQKNLTQFNSKPYKIGSNSIQFIIIQFNSIHNNSIQFRNFESPITFHPEKPVDKKGS